jgi:hypothetical protein
MKLDRPLSLLLTFIVSIAILALVFYLLNTEKPEFVSEHQPADVLQNYFLALQNRSYELAYSYLAEEETKPDFNLFRQTFSNSLPALSETSIEIGETQIIAGQAQVNVTLVYVRQGFAGEFRREQQSTILVLQEGEWRIQNSPYPYWSWDWYESSKPLVEPVPEQK